MHFTLIFSQKLAHTAARFGCDSWPICMVWQSKCWNCSGQRWHEI